MGEILEAPPLHNNTITVEVLGDHTPRARQMGFFTGLVLWDPVIYDTKSVSNFIAAVNKNLAPQVRDGRVTAGVKELMAKFVIEETTCGIDIMTPKVEPTSSKWTKDDVIVNARAKGLSRKADKYEDAIPDSESCSHSMETKNRWTGDHFIKSEALKPGKLPRLIFNARPADVLVGRTVNSAYEEWMHRYPSVKGLATQDKWIPVSDVHNALGGDTWVLCLDDTARDANTVRADFERFKKTLKAIGLDDDVYSGMLDRQGFSSRYKVGFQAKLRVASNRTSLLSGCDFTSCMNYNTTRFNAYYLCYRLGLSKNDWGVVAEGDDCVILIRKSAMPDFMTRVTPALIEAIGLELCKRWKIESLGSYDKELGHPFVGGTVVHSSNRWWFFPSTTRMRLKSTVVVSSHRDEKQLRERLAARAEALRDRFSMMPLGYSIAKFVTHLSAKYPAKEPRRTAEEEYNHAIHRNVVFRKYSDEVLSAFWKATGISPAQVLEFDCLIDGAIHRGVDVLDLRHMTMTW